MDIDASVYTFGFGRDHDPEMLKAISDAANGMYYFIENEEQVRQTIKDNSFYGDISYTY